MLYSCRGCGRNNLFASEMGQDKSKPSGLHSRCRVCKKRQKDRKPTVLTLLRDGPQPPPKPVERPVVSREAKILRDGMIELVRRHRGEYEDILHFLKDKYPLEDKRWIKA